MSMRLAGLESRLAKLDPLLATLRGGPTLGIAIARWRADAAALRFHLRHAGDDTRRPRIVAILGGTGTGKSTLLNRLLGVNVSATSFRRTFTSGPVAVAREPKDLPGEWLGVTHELVDASLLPASGKAGELLVVTIDHPLTSRAVLVDTPDLDGDQPAHHAQADRAFRWADAILFLVTPEKYQMIELLPYYRLARRYALPALFVMNKCEEPAVLEDFGRQLADREWAGASFFAIPRDDAAYQPPADADLESLRGALGELAPRGDDSRRSGISNRTTDLLGRLKDQIVGPQRQTRRDVDRATEALRAIETPPPGVDVNPITQQLQRRLQQRSILYLMGPRRMLDRVRQVPSMLVRLPRTTWDLISGKSVAGATNGAPGLDDQGVPDFGAVLTDQFRVVQSRIDDVLRSLPATEAMLADRAAAYASVKLDPAEAGKIASEELGDLKEWLEKKWNATPRDTVLLLRLLKHLPGGEKLTQWSEAAPYLLAVVVATHHAFFGHIDLLILGGYSLFTWLTERLSNEVALRTRQANRKIAERFARIAHEQIERTCAWLQEQAPDARTLAKLGEATDDLAGAAGIEAEAPSATT